MADANAQIFEIKANANRFTNAAVRGVQGGFVVTGQVQYQDKDTKGIVLTENAEGVAASTGAALDMVSNYLNSGTFDAPALKDNVGEARVAVPDTAANPFAAQQAVI